MNYNKTPKLEDLFVEDTNLILSDAKLFVQDRAKTYLKAALKDDRGVSGTSPYGHLVEIQRQVIGAINAEFDDILSIARNNGVLQFGECESNKEKKDEGSSISRLFRPGN
jgi:hypothetical protein